MPCSREEAELHVRAFIASFIARAFRERWVIRLLETKHPVDIANVYNYFDEQCVADRCRHLSDRESNAAQLRSRFGIEQGVYFGQGSKIYKLTAAEAATMAFEEYAMWSFKPGLQAVLFMHDNPAWLCENLSQ